MDEISVSAIVASNRFEFAIGKNKYNKAWDAKKLHFGCILVFRYDSRIKLVDHRLAVKPVTKLKSKKDILPLLKDIEIKTEKTKHLLVYITNAITFTHSVRDNFFEKSVFQGMHGGKGPFCALVFGLQGKKFTEILLTARSEKPFKVEKQVLLPKYVKEPKKVVKKEVVPKVQPVQIPFYLPVSISEEHTRILQSHINCVGYIYRNLDEYFKKITPSLPAEKANYKNRLHEVMNYLFKYNTNLNQLMGNHKKTDLVVRNLMMHVKEKLSQPGQPTQGIENDLKEKIKHYEKRLKNIVDEKVAYEKLISEKNDREKKMIEMIQKLNLERKQMVEEKVKFMKEMSKMKAELEKLKLGEDKEMTTTTPEENDEDGEEEGEDSLEEEREEEEGEDPVEEEEEEEEEENKEVIKKPEVEEKEEEVGVSQPANVLDQPEEEKEEEEEPKKKEQQQQQESGDHPEKEEEEAKEEREGEVVGEEKEKEPEQEEKEEAKEQEEEEEIEAKEGEAKEEKGGLEDKFFNHPVEENNINNEWND